MAKEISIFDLLVELMERDQSLIAHNFKNDKKAFKIFFEGFYPSICVFAKKYLQDSDLAEDLAQEAFIEFWKVREQFADFQSGKGFIYTVTRNKCLNAIKQRSIREQILNETVFSDDYFYELILEEETYGHIYQAVNKLAAQSRKIVLLSMEGVKNQEIADFLQVSVNTVKTLKKNAYKELRINLKDYSLALFLIGHFLK